MNTPTVETSQEISTPFQKCQEPISYTVSQLRGHQQARSQPTVPRGQPDFREARAGGHTHRHIHILKRVGTGNGASLEGDFGKEIHYAPP